MRWADSLVRFIVTVGSLPIQVLVTFLGMIACIVVLLVLTIRLSGIKKLSLKDGLEFKDDEESPKKPMKRRPAKR